MSEYNQQQVEAFMMVRHYLHCLSRARIRQVKRRVRNYMRFRADVAAFQTLHFSEICTHKCFTSQTSACCGREGIATFFADVVINVLLSSEVEVDAVLQALFTDRGGFKCVYLTEDGCVWRLKPIVCEMFLCRHAKENVFSANDALQKRWERLRRRERRYTWPSGPVLFDEMEELFIRAGYDSPLMYLHHSPGLLRVKERSGKFH
ncbi:MAG: hypothetical protein K8R45_00450 [Desulfobacterales bacterium]|nr:hypothetical protein [Desulfobacterales bacterium]